MNKMFRVVLFFLLSQSCMYGNLLEEHCHKRNYPLNRNPIDVVIPCVQKDLITLPKCIKFIRKYGSNIRRIIVLSPMRLTNLAEWIPEDIFPFTKEDIALAVFKGDKKRAIEYEKSPHNRLGWLFQQLLKFYAPFVIPEISNNVLILDADVLFLRPISFQTHDGGPLFNPGAENHHPYFEHAAKLIPGFSKVYPSYSGISHHMLFQRSVLEELFHMVEGTHKKPFWQAFCSCIHSRDIFESGASEYEIYFNFFFSTSDQGRVRKLKWLNISSLQNLMHYRRKGYHYVACHSYCREPSQN